MMHDNIDDMSDINLDKTVPAPKEFETSPKTPRWNILPLIGISLAIPGGILGLLAVISIITRGDFKEVNPISLLSMTIVLAVPIFAFLLDGRRDKVVASWNDINTTEISRFAKDNGLMTIADIPDGIKNTWSLRNDSMGKDANLISEHFGSIYSKTQNGHTVTIFSDTKTYHGRDENHIEKRWIVAITINGTLPDIFLFDPLMNEMEPLAQNLPLPIDTTTRYSLHAERAYGNEVYETLTKDLLEFLDSNKTPHHIEFSRNKIIFTLPADSGFEKDTAKLESTFNFAALLADRFGGALDRISLTPVGDISSALPQRHVYVGLIAISVFAMFLLIILLADPSSPTSPPIVPTLLFVFLPIAIIMWIVYRRSIHK